METIQTTPGGREREQRIDGLIERFVNITEMPRLWEEGIREELYPDGFSKGITEVLEGYGEESPHKPRLNRGAYTHMALRYNQLLLRSRMKIMKSGLPFAERAAILDATPVANFDAYDLRQFAGSPPDSDELQTSFKEQYEAKKQQIEYTQELLQSGTMVLRVQGNSADLLRVDDQGLSSMMTSDGRQVFIVNGERLAFNFTPNLYGNLYAKPEQTWRKILPEDIYTDNPDEFITLSRLLEIGEDKIDQGYYFTLFGDDAISAWLDKAIMNLEPHDSNQDRGNYWRLRTLEMAYRALGEKVPEQLSRFSAEWRRQAGEDLAYELSVRAIGALVSSSKSVDDAYRDYSIPRIDNFTPMSDLVDQVSRYAGLSHDEIISKVEARYAASLQAVGVNKSEIPERLPQLRQKVLEIIGS